jgi:hypothetical protein
VNAKRIIALRRSGLNAGAAAALAFYFPVADLEQPASFAILAGLLFVFRHDVPSRDAANIGLMRLNKPAMPRAIAAKLRLDAVTQNSDDASGSRREGFPLQDPNQRRAKMKKIIFGTIAAAAVIASVSAASAQNRMDRNWSEIRATSMESTYEQPARRKGISYGYNLRFERADVGK